MAKATLADDLVELHRESEAAEIAHQAATGFESLLGADNSYTLSAWQTYGTATCAGQQKEVGLTALRHVETARRRLFAPDDPLVASAAVAVGSCLARMNRYAEAEPALLIGLAGLEATRGPQYRRTQSAYSSLRDLYSAMGRTEESALFAAKVRN
jgi:hypothetical protein